MKQLLILLCILSGYLSQAQISGDDLQYNSALGYNYRNIYARERAFLPKDTLSTADSGAIAFINPTLYVKTSTKWVEWGFKKVDDSTYVSNGDTLIITGGGGSPTDTSSLSTRIDLKLNISDTASMLLNYIRRQELADTAASIRLSIGGGGVLWGGITGTISDQTDLQDALNDKVNVSDTSTMLIPYLRKADTATMLIPFLRKVDTASMLLPYLRKVDTTAMLSTYARKTQVSDSLATIRNAKKWPAEERIGTIYSAQRWDKLADLTPNTSSGTVSLALSGGFINYTVSSIDWNNYTRLLYTRPTILPNWTMEVIFKMNTAPSAATVGFGGGTKKYISQNADVFCYINTTNGAASGNLNILRADGGATYGSSVATGPVSQNDVIKLTISFADSVVTFTALNITTGSTGTMSYTSPLNSAPALSAISNWGLIGHSSTSCTWQIQSIKISSETKRNATLVVIGDSKTQGAFATYYNSRTGAKLGMDYPSSFIYASGGATVADFLNLREELTYLNGMQYLVHLGSNSIRGGASVVNTIKDLQTLDGWITGGGATARYILAPEDTVTGSANPAGLTALHNAMASVFGARYISSVFTGMSTSNVLNAGYNSGDGVHINQAGNDFIRTTTVSSAGFITRPVNMIPPYRVTDNNIKQYGDSLSLFEIGKKYGYVPSWTINGGLTTGVLQDNGTMAGVSQTPMIGITGSVWNTTGMHSINGATGSLVFGAQGASLTAGRWSVLVPSSNRFTIHDPVAGQDRFTIDPTTGYVGIGTPSQDSKLDILDAVNDQLRLTNVDGSVHTKFKTTSTGKLVIDPTGALVEIAGVIKTTSTTASVVDSIVVVEDGVHKTTSIASLLTALGIAAADFVPTLTGIANVDAVTLIDAHYMRIQDQVTFDAMISIDPTVISTTTNVDATLPISSTITNFTNLTGIITSGDGVIGNIVAVGNKARIGFVSNSTSSTTYNIHVSYKIQ